MQTTVDQMMEVVLDTDENIVGKGESAAYQLLPQDC